MEIVVIADLDVGVLEVAAHDVLGELSIPWRTVKASWIVNWVDERRGVARLLHCV